MTMKHALAAAGAAMLLATTAAVGLAETAHAAPILTVTPNSGLKDGDVVTVTYTGFSPNAPVAVGVCPTDRIDDIKGPGDCGRSKNGNSKLTTADASGEGSARITIPRGALGNATPPAAKCPPCSIGATNISNAAEKANVALKYGKAGSQSPPPSKLPPTGPREAAIAAIGAFVALQVGVVLFVRAHRASPRRIAG